MNFILSHVYQQFTLWGNDHDILSQLILILQSLSKKQECIQIMLTSPSFSEIVGYLINNIQYFPSDTHSQIIQTIAYIGSQSANEAAKLHYLQGLTMKIESFLMAIINHPGFQQNYETAAIREKAIVALEMFHGLALSIEEETTILIFESIARHFGSLIKLLQLYHSYPDIEAYILQIFKDLIKNQNHDNLEPNHRKILFESVHSIIQVYSKNEVGKRRDVKNLDEEELFEDLSLILDILASLISAEYEGFERDTVIARIQKSEFQIDVAQIVFVGVNAVLPLITHEMLQYPALCIDYINLVGLLIDYFPDKLEALPPALLNSLVKSLFFGTQQSLGKISDISFKAIQSLGLYSWVQTASSKYY